MPKVQAAVKAIIVNDGKFLLIKQIVDGKEIWEVPGGRMEYDSTPEKCILREVREEVGLDVGIIRQVGTYHFFRNDNGDQIICLTYLCKPKHIKVDLSKNVDKEEDIKAFVWMTKEEFLQSELCIPHPSFVELIKNIEF